MTDRTELTNIRKWSEGLLAVALVWSLAACTSEEQSAQTAAPEDTAPAMADGGTQGMSEMPEGLEISGRFADMFVSEISEEFNPGLPIGASFPAIRAMYEGEEIMSIDRFIRDKGAIFIAMRSVDW